MSIASVCVHFGSLDGRLILSKQVVKEQQQRHQAQLYQLVLDALQTNKDDACEVPDGIALPVTNVRDLNELEWKLENDDTTWKLVSCLF